MLGQGRLCLYYSGSKGLWLGVFHDDGDVKLQNVPLLNGMRLKMKWTIRGGWHKLILTEAAGEVVFLICRIYLVGLPGHRFEKGQCNAQTRVAEMEAAFSLGQSPLSRPNIIGLAKKL